MTDVIESATLPASQDTDNVVLFPTTEAVGNADQMPGANVGTDANEQPEIEDGDSENEDDDQPEGGDGDDEDDETPDALDIAAAQIVHDYERRTLSYPEPVDGVELLNELVTTIRRFMVLPDGAAEVLALAVVLSYALYPCGMRFAPRIMIRKPVSNSGGTNLVSLLLHLVRRPTNNSGITDATFFRQANQRRTVIIDECDNATIHSNRKLARMLNASHGVTGTESRTEKNQHGRFVPVAYRIFALVILCGIGNFAPVTVRNRSFVIALMRKMMGEEADEFNAADHAPMLRTLREKVMRWVEDHIEAIRDCRPVLDRVLYQNRQRENIVTMLQIADVVGPEWGQRARDALTIVTARDKPVDDNELLIGDIAEILLDPDVMVGDPPHPIGTGGVVFSTDLFGLLKERFPHRVLYESNWTQARLASMLGTFDIETHGKRRGKQVLRAYNRSDFDDPIARYAGEVAAMFAEAESAPVVEATEGVSPLRGEPVEAVEAATPQHPEPRSSVADAPTAAAEAVVDAATPLHVLFPNAHHEKPAKGDKKKADRLCRAVIAAIGDGKFKCSDVMFICALFWLIERRDGQRLWACVDDEDGTDLELVPIKAPGLVADNAKERIIINERMTIRDVTTGDYQKYRALVNKARRIMLNA